MKVATHYDLALSVAHLWDMPDVVREYLETRNPEIRTSALMRTGRYNGSAIITGMTWKNKRDAAASAAHAAIWGALRGDNPDVKRRSQCMTIWAVANALGLGNDHISDVIQRLPDASN